jgi:putative nucleotide binding protein
MEMEEYGYVLDYLPNGRSSERIPEPMAQIIGENHFTLLEVTIKAGMALSLGQRVYAGRETRQEVDRIRRRIEFPDLTAAARNELPRVLSSIVHAREAHFVNFFNKAGPLSIRLHQLEIMHGIGKKHLSQILDARDTKQFESFADIHGRVPLLPDPAGLVSSRIIEELEGRSVHYLFVRPPSKREE